MNHPKSLGYFAFGFFAAFATGFYLWWILRAVKWEQLFYGILNRLFN